MKILIVCSLNNHPNIRPFISEQADALAKLGHEIKYFVIKEKGITGYLKHYFKLRKQIKKEKYDLIHAHFGLSGAMSVLQRKIPVVITFHNGETLSKKGNLISSIASLFSAYNIYVAQHIYDKCYFKCKNKSLILPCGINIDEFTLISKEEAIRNMNLPTNKINITFGGEFSNIRKNVKLARQAIDLLQRDDINLIELYGYNKQQLNNLLCGCDLMLLTTKSEGSPQIIKEAMACNCPIVATNVADIKQLMGNIDGCFLTSFDVVDVAQKIKKAIFLGKRTQGRILMQKYDNKIVAKTISTQVYNKVIMGNV